MRRRHVRLLLLYQHIKYDAGSYEGFEEDREDDQLCPEQTANGTDFTDIQVNRLRERMVHQIHRGKHNVFFSD